MHTDNATAEDVGNYRALGAHGTISKGSESTMEELSAIYARFCDDFAEGNGKVWGSTKTTAFVSTPPSSSSFSLADDGEKAVVSAAVVVKPTGPSVDIDQPTDPPVPTPGEVKSEDRTGEPRLAMAKRAWQVSARQQQPSKRSRGPL